MSSPIESVDIRKFRAKYINWWVISTLVVPSVLDYFFQNSSMARYSRVLLFVAIFATLLINQKYFLKGKLVGVETILLVFGLYTIGTISDLSHGGVVTPNIALLILLLFILSSNVDLREIMLSAVGKSIHILVFLSAIVIVLKLNPRGYYSSADGYPIFFDFIGIPGRNYGIFSHPNTLGNFAALSTLFMIESKIKKFYLIAPFLCIIKCGSRTAIIVIVIGVITLLMLKKLKTNASSKIVNKNESRLAIGTFILGLLLASLAQFLNYINRFDPQALVDRVQIWQLSIGLFKSSSIFGLGWGWSARAIQSQLLSIWANSAHNAILEIVFASGLAGILIFLFLLTKVLIYFKNLQTLEKALLITLLISGVTESFVDLQYPTIQTYLYFMIVLSANSKRGADRD